MPAGPGAQVGTEVVEDLEADHSRPLQQAQRSVGLRRDGAEVGGPKPGRVEKDRPGAGPGVVAEVIDPGVPALAATQQIGVG